ncbi:TMEM175 family protein [Legionella gresilensis]|uniref:TMEM175 family protein n=1 Tax=Legionella gresilensis TaxID=91823 RepID=UPI001041ACFE|nr:TMEM175 family protein [Legionella gresilensis]
MRVAWLEVFSDVVLAIIITIMVLEIKFPHDDFSSLIPLVPVFLSYLLSFIYIGIYWNHHHHHLFTAVESISGKVLWANLNLLFWLSLFPFTTGWMEENQFTATPTAIYGVVLAAISYYILVHVLIKHEGKQSFIGKAIGKDFKGKISIFLYAFAILMAYILTWAAQLIYVIVAIIWFIPDKRIENLIK